MIILGIETSCDETSVALVQDGRRVLASHIASQIRIHQHWGGVVPELASRAHIKMLLPMIRELLDSQNMQVSDLDAIACTQGPGLVGALLIGLETAKSLAYVSGKPLIPVHHVAAHLYAPFLVSTDTACKVTMISPDDEAGTDTVHTAKGQTLAELADMPPLAYPYVGLAVSGGHTSLALVREPSKFELLAETVDDAAGEAFDKVAKLLELGYPGGPIVDRLARTEGTNGKRYDLPRPMMRRDQRDFSFSGLKTATSYLIRDLGGPEAVKADPQILGDVCASFQQAVVEVLLTKARRAMDTAGVKQLAIVGGVACNGGLRAGAARLLGRYSVVFPPPAFCTDNAAMVAGLAYHLRDEHVGKINLSLNAVASMPLPH